MGTSAAACGTSERVKEAFERFEADVEVLRQRKGCRLEFRSYPGRTNEEFAEIEDELRQRLGSPYPLHSDIRAVFGAAASTHLQWSLEAPGQPLTGTLRIEWLDLIICTDEELRDSSCLLMTEDRRFDWIWEGNEVRIAFHQDGTYRLFYLGTGEGERHQMTTSLPDYTRAAFECLGLYGWQRFFLLEYTPPLDFPASFMRRFEEAFPGTPLPRWVNR